MIQSASRERRRAVCAGMGVVLLALGCEAAGPNVDAAAFGTLQQNQSRPAEADGGKEDPDGPPGVRCPECAVLIVSLEEAALRLDAPNPFYVEWLTVDGFIYDAIEERIDYQEDYGPLAIDSLDVLSLGWEFRFARPDPLELVASRFRGYLGNGELREYDFEGGVTRLVRVIGDE